MMTDDVAAFLDAAEARAAAATPGPWEPGDGWVFESGPYESPSERLRGVAYRVARADVPFIAAARSDLPVLVGMVRSVLALHKPWRIYDECEHGHDEDDPARVDCGDFTSCEASFMYETCAECCQEDGYMTEHCVDCHNHGPGKPRCPTLAAIPPTPTAEETP